MGELKTVVRYVHPCNPRYCKAAHNILKYQLHVAAFGGVFGVAAIAVCKAAHFFGGFGSGIQ